MLKKIQYIIMAALLTLTIVPPFATNTKAKECPDVQVIFARGSGGPQDISSDYLEFKSTIETKLQTTNLTYGFMDLEYPAVGVGFSDSDTASTTIGAYFSGGESYKFGESMWQGVEKLKETAVDTSCQETKYVLGGYSQGAMVLLNTLPYFKPENVIYVATFGDPKIYLPEGKGIIPDACSGKNLSSYRMYVPDCHAYEGILGSYIPYEPEAYKGKVGTWCNKGDILCSSRFSINDHVGYVSEGLYEDASRVIFAKICDTFNIENEITSPHDTAILIDSTGSMEGLIEKYKSEALRLAKKTLDSGGRVALYDYRDLNDPYQPVEHCNFTTCTLAKFEEELNSITTGGGDDKPESLLSSSYTVMQNLEWKYGATKSVVVLTDAGYHSPDIDGKTFADVVNMSKSIDPVNFYIITGSELVDYYGVLAEATGGMVAVSTDDLSILTDTIMARYDSLPRVEEDDDMTDLPEITITNINYDNGVKVEFDNSGTSALVILNDYMLGITNNNFVIIEDLDKTINNQLKLVPLNETRRGDAAIIELGNIIIPKAPDTGIIKS